MNRCVRFASLWVAAAIAWMACSGCGEDPVSSDVMSGVLRLMRSGSPVALVLNGLGETLSVIDVEAGTVTNNVMALGALPNHLTLTPDERSMLVTVSGANRVDVVDLEALAVVGSVDLGAGSNPWETAVVDERTAVVSEWLADSVARIDWRTGAVLARVDVPPSPQGVAVVDGTIYVASTLYATDPGLGPRGVLSVIEGDSVVASIPVGRNPQYLLAVGSELHVVCTGRFGLDEGMLMVIDLERRAVVDSLAVGGNPGFAVQRGAHVYLCGYYGGLMKYAWEERAILNDSRNPVLPFEGLFGLDVDPVRGDLYLALFADDLVVAVEADTIRAQWTVGDGPQRVVLRRSNPIGPRGDPLASCLQPVLR